MLPKKNRVDKKTIEKIFQEGSFVNSSNLTLKFLKKRAGEKRISFIAPKSVARLAVQRNFLRRLGYRALTKQLDKFPLGFVGVFIFKKNIDSVQEIEKEIKIILTKLENESR